MTTETPTIAVERAEDYPVEDEEVRNKLSRADVLTLVFSCINGQMHAVLEFVVRAVEKTVAKQLAKASKERVDAKLQRRVRKMERGMRHAARRAARHVVVDLDSSESE